MLICAHLAFISKEQIFYTKIRLIYNFNSLKSYLKFIFSKQACQRDIKRLRERELSLQGDLAAAGKEILRLRDLLNQYMPPTESTSSSSHSPM